ncbi:MAG: hypothetical protein QNL77_02625 [Akkermansiaceae bacterium]
MLQFPKDIKHSKSYKKIAYFLTLGFAALFLSSCCGFGVGCGGKIVNANEDNCTVSQTVGKSVLRLATAQNGTGEPHIGTIPTMKILAK